MLGLDCRLRQAHSPAQQTSNHRDPKMISNNTRFQDTGTLSLNINTDTDEKNSPEKNLFHTKYLYLVPKKICQNGPDGIRTFLEHAEKSPNTLDTLLTLSKTISPNKIYMGEISQPKNPDSCNSSIAQTNKSDRNSVRVAVKLLQFQKVSTIPHEAIIHSELMQRINDLDSISKESAQNICGMYMLGVPLEFGTDIAINAQQSDKFNMILVEEYCDCGDILELILNNQQMNTSNQDYPRIDREEHLKFLFKQMVQAVEFCHKNDISHGDLKLENFGLKFQNNSTEKSMYNLQVKLLDFGFGCLLGSHDFTVNSNPAPVAGSLEYLSPECITDIYSTSVDSSSEDLDPISQKALWNERKKASDIWALGVCLYAMGFAKFPFGGEWGSNSNSGSNLAALFGKIAAGILEFPKIRKDGGLGSNWWFDAKKEGTTDQCVSDLSTFKNLLRQMLRVDYRKRIKAHELIAEEWISNKN